MTPRVLVVGSGASAWEAAREVVAQGGGVVLVRFRGVGRTCSLRTPSGIDLVDDGSLERLEGSPGRFVATVRSGDDEFPVKCGAVILAPGRYERTLSGDGIMSLREADAVGTPPGLNSVAILLTPRSPRSSFIAAVRVAVSLLSRRPRPAVHLLADEMQAYGFDELDYRRAQEEGAVMVRTSGPLEVRTSPPTVRAVDRPSGLQVEVFPDLLVIDHSGGTADDGTVLGVRGHVSMGAVSTMREGVLTIGAECDLLDQECTTRARAAASRALTLAAAPPDRTSAAAVVDRDRCSACLTCARSCPFGAAHPGEEGKASIDGALCQACGICVGACPSRALSLPEEQNAKNAIEELP